VGGFSLAMGGRLAALASPPTSQTYLDVTSFGAKGDGRTDDTKAIQAALDTVANINGLNQPVAVFVPPGVYCTRQLQMHSNSGRTSRQWSRHRKRTLQDDSGRTAL
jgi:polygalacturonase